MGRDETGYVNETGRVKKEALFGSFSSGFMTTTTTTTIISIIIVISINSIISIVLIVLLDPRWDCGGFFVLR